MVTLKNEFTADLSTPRRSIYVLTDGHFNGQPPDLGLLQQSIGPSVQWDKTVQPRAARLAMPALQHHYWLEVGEGTTSLLFIIQVAPNHTKPCSKPPSQLIIHRESMAVGFPTRAHPSNNVKSTPPSPICAAAAGTASAPGLWRTGVPTGSYT